MIDKILSVAISATVMAVVVAAAAVPAWLLSGQGRGAVYGVLFLWGIATGVKLLWGDAPDE